VVVAFRGTASLSDVAVDAWGGYPGGPPLRIYFPFAEWQVGSSAVAVHRNFHTTYQSAKASVRKIVKDLFDANPALTKLYVTGHSLGGGLATLCALDLATGLSPTDSKVPLPRLYTFASPLVGNQALATLVGQKTLESYRIADPDDWVTGVPHEGETPTYQRWVAGGKVGPEPTMYEPYVHVQAPVAVDNQRAFPSCHWLESYYRSCIEMTPAGVAPGLKPTDPVRSLVVRIKTADRLGAGTDADVYLRLLGVNWGPLDRPDKNDFEQGSIGVYDLFAMFPSKVPANPTCGQLNELVLGLGFGYWDTWSGSEWEPAWIEVEVNGAATKIILSGSLHWSTTRQVSALLKMTSNQPIEGVTHA